MLFSCKPNKQEFDVQGHRGCRGLMPENTIPAFLKAVDLGVTTLELDVVISADAEVVVSHEPVLNPVICLDPQGNLIADDVVFNLYQMDYDSIAKCDCGSRGNPKFPDQELIPAFKPKLADVIKAVKMYCEDNGTLVPNFNVEIKAQSKYVFLYHPPISVFADAVVEVLGQELPLNKYTIQSFDVMTLQYVHQSHPQIELVYLVESDKELDLAGVDDYVKQLGFVPSIFSCYYPMLNQGVVNKLHEMGIRVIPWTVNTKEDMEALINMGVDGIITDYPDRLHAKLINR